jgi:LCP family protein required for cell wall assembly
VSRPAESPEQPQKQKEPPQSESGQAPGRRRRRWPRVLAVAIVVLLVSGSGLSWYAYRHLDGNIRTDTDTDRALLRMQSQRPSAVASAVGGQTAENILIIGSDNRGDGNGEYGRDTGSQRSDTVILLHLSADRSRVTGVSIPRDLMVGIPSCRRADGSRSAARTAQFNWAFEFGGAACTIRTLEEMTGIRVDHHIIVDFTGFKKVVDAVGGVEVCVPHAVHDPDAHLDLPAGLQTLHGEDALGWVRARKGIGDGSDTQRMERQQQFLASLVRKIDTSGVLLNPAKLYPLLEAATASLTADEGLDSLSELYGLMRSLRATATDGVTFLTVPRRPYVYDHNRDELVQPAANRLFEALREDRPADVAATPSASSSTPSGEPAAASQATGSSSADPGGTARRDACGAGQG